MATCTYTPNVEIRVKQIRPYISGEDMFCFRLTSHKRVMGSRGGVFVCVCVLFFLGKGWAMKNGNGFLGVCQCQKCKMKDRWLK